MKKLIGTVAVAALLASAAFAEVNFGAWCNSVYFIGSNESGSVKHIFAQPWSADTTDTPRWLGLNAMGDSEHGGFLTEFQVNGKKLNFGQAFTYIKPIEQIQLIFGFTDQNYLRTDNLTFQHDYTRPGAIKIGEGITFEEFEVGGIGLLVTPVESLKIFAGYDVPYLGKGAGDFQDDIGRTGKLGVAYTIGDIGTVKAGVRAQGKNYDKDGEEKDRVKVGVAFDLTAVDGLFVTVGAKIPLGGVYNEDLTREPVNVAAGIGLNFIENLRIQLNFNSKINAAKLEDGDVDGNFGFALELGADYMFADGWTVFGAVGYASNVYNSTYKYDEDDAVFSGSTKDCLSFGVGIEKSWSNSKIGIEFVGATNYNTLLDSDGKKADGTGFSWLVPIKMNVSF